MPITTSPLSAIEDNMLPPQVDSMPLENYLDFSYGRCEIRRYSWSRSLDDIFSLDEKTCAINFALSARPAPTKVISLDAGPTSVPENINRTLVIYPGSKLKLSAPRGELRSMICLLDLRRIEECFQEKFDWHRRVFSPSSSPLFPEIEWLLDNICREINSTGAMRELAVESFVNVLCIKLFRYLGQGQESQSQLFRGGLAPAQLRKIRERVHADEPAPTLVELAQLCGISVRHLSRGFKQSTGQTIGQYIEKVMVDRAFSLLRESNLTIAAIARRLGYAGSTSFSFAFRRATGFRPSEIERKKQ